MHFKKIKKKLLIISVLYFSFLFAIVFTLIRVQSNIDKQRFLMADDNSKRIELLHQLSNEVTSIFMTSSMLFLQKENKGESNFNEIQKNLDRFQKIWLLLEKEDAEKSRINIKNMAEQFKSNFLLVKKKQIQWDSFQTFFLKWQSSINEAFKFEDQNNKHAFQNIKEQQNRATRLNIIIAILACPILAITSLFLYFNLKKD